MARLLLLVGAALVFSGCVFPADGGPFGDDPFATCMAPVNREYKESNWVAIPTGIGNVLGGIGFSPLAAVIAPFEWAIQGHTEKARVATGTVSAGGYLGGFGVGSPFLVLYWAFYKFWVKSFGSG